MTTTGQQAELAKKINDIAQLNGTFKLRSGETSNIYFDKYRFEAQPELLREVAKGLAKSIPSDTEALAGLEMGGIPVATALSLETGLPVVFVRKEAKSYGTCQFAEGLDIAGKNLLVVEDVVTSGGQLILSTEDLRGEKAIVKNAVCVILRNPDATEKLREKGIELSCLFTKEQLLSS